MTKAFFVLSNISVDIWWLRKNMAFKEAEKNTHLISSLCLNKDILFTSIKFIFAFLVAISIWKCDNLNEKIELERTKCIGKRLIATVQKDSLCFNELIDSLSLIRLETTPTSLFGDITKIEILNDTIIIFDFQNQSVLTFDLKGKFIGKIGKIGKGPEELLNINSIALDKTNHEVLILDDRKSKVFHFKLNGKFVSGEDAQVYPFDFIIENEQLIFYQNKSSYYFDKEIKYDLLITKNGTIKQKYFQFSNALSFRYPLNRVFYESNDTIHYVDKWDSKVYSIINGEIIQKYCIDFMGDEIPLEYTEDEELFDSKHKKYAYLYDYFIENTSYIYFRYFQNEELNRVIYNKENKDYHTFSNDKDSRDLLSVFFTPIYSYNDYFVSTIQPYLLIEAEKRSALNYNLKNALLELEQSDNLLLAFYKLRE
ncbi:MAG: 6-bladed beta-propeller [bacterium]